MVLRAHDGVMGLVVCMYAAARASCRHNSQWVSMIGDGGSMQLYICRSRANSGHMHDCSGQLRMYAWWWGQAMRGQVAYMYTAAGTMTWGEQVPGCIGTCSTCLAVRQSNKS